VETVKKVLLTVIRTCGETTHANPGAGAWDRTEVISRGGDIEPSATESESYSHARVVWDYHLHVDQLATPTVSPRHVYL
jgi:hypothetical protein